uniref:Uncharacterized protein n=1 Tax=Prolemur simus TaxID=1328070 RepID=A0A8C8Z027_PROSS
MTTSIAGQCGNQIRTKHWKVIRPPWWTWSQAPWTVCSPGLMGDSSGLTISSPARRAQGTTGRSMTTTSARSS